MRHVDVSFGLCDRLNPGFGYQLEIQDAQNGAVLLATSIHPATGADLLAPADCIAVAAMYCGKSAEEPR
jgi:hypothetical protein